MDMTQGFSGEPSFYERLSQTMFPVEHFGERARALLAGAVPSQPEIVLYGTDVRQDFEDKDGWFFFYQCNEAAFYLIEQGCDPESISYVEVDEGEPHDRHIWLGRKLS